MRIIGTDSFGYNQLRNFAGLDVNGYHFKKVYDGLQWINDGYETVYNKPHPYCNYFFRDFGINHVEFFHFYNKVYFGKKSWLVTFDNELPRHNSRNYPGMYALVKDNCIQILAMSQRAYNSQIYHMQRYEKEVCDEIMDKMIVLHPPQHLYVQNIYEKYGHEKFTFSFVGSKFYRKGGQEILLAAQRLFNEGYDFELNIVSDLKKGDWKDQHIEKKDFALTHKIITENKRWINHIPFMNQVEVVELYKRSDVALLPSYGEIYNYEVLLAQACGTPVVTTNMPPLNEVNDDEIGWMCNAPIIYKHGAFTSDTFRPGSLKIFQKSLFDFVYASMKNALENPDRVKLKGMESIKRIIKEHDPADVIRMLSILYRRS